MENKNQNGRYRVVITDTETGEVERDECYNVIIAGLNGNETNAELSITTAPGADICLGIVQAKAAIEHTKAFLVSKGGISKETLDFAIKAAEFLFRAKRDGGEE